MSYTPTPQYSMPSSSFRPPVTSTPPLPPPKPQAPQHNRSASASLAYSSAIPPPPPPPRPYNQDDRPYTPQIPTTAGAPEPQTPYPPSQPHQQPTSDYQLPPILHTLSTPDLQHLLTQPALLAALIHAPSTSPAALSQHSNPTLQSALATNSQLAHSLLSLLHHLLHTRSSTTHQLLHVRALEQAWKLKQHELESKLEPWSPRALHARLVKEIAEGEAVCVGIEESFLEEGGGGVAGEREVGEWLKRVREGREVWWARRARRERWDEGRVGGWR